MAVQPSRSSEPSESFFLLVSALSLIQKALNDHLSAISYKENIVFEQIIAIISISISITDIVSVLSDYIIVLYYNKNSTKNI